VRGFLEYDDRILIFDRKVETYEYLSLPGGGVMVGESQEQALIREFKEETNLDIELGEFLYEEKEYNDIVTHRIYRVNAQRIGKVEVLGEEADYDQNKNSYKLVWLTPDEILQKNISENFRSYLKKNY
jgi:8-oxo-dGTP pyrophosphatase MutT (NUDIX family)